MFRPTNLNSAWLQEELFKPWLAAVEKYNHKAKCTVCGLTFELSNMGKQSLISHLTVGLLWCFFFWLMKMSWIQGICCC